MTASQEGGPRVDARVRTARRHDAAALVDLRVRYLAEIGRLEPRFALLPDVRDRSEHVLPLWIEQDDRRVFVAEDAATKGLIGYAVGLEAVWPPVFKRQHVGEVAEVYVLEASRGAGVGRELLAQLGAALRRGGAEVLRAAVPARGADSLERFRALGYEPLQHVLTRALDDG